MSAPSSPTPAPASGSSTGRLVVSWLVVLLPLAWGVAQVVVRSLQLFR